MLRTVWLAIVGTVITLVVSPQVLIIALVNSSSPRIDRLIRFWARVLVRGAGIRLTVENAHRVDPERRYVLVANHHSYLDIPCLLAGIPQPIRFMAKASLFQIPLFGQALAASGFIPVDRKNRSKAIESFDRAAERIRKGNTIVIFPEEGRSKQRQMLPFQRGGFLLALRSELPLLPVAIDGTYEVLPATRLSIRSGPVTLRVAEVVETAGFSVRNREELSNKVRGVIEGLLPPAPEA